MFAAAIIQRKESHTSQGEELSQTEGIYSGRNLAGLFALGALAVLWNFYDDLPLQ